MSQPQQPQWAALPTPSPGTGQQGTPTPQPLALSQPIDPTATAGPKKRSAVASTPGIPDIPDLPDNHPRESLVVYYSRLISTSQEHLARPIVQLQQMGMFDMFEFFFTDVKIVLLSLGPRS
ncbi:hypothetical protein T492DRAFT_857060 [Pavlovales sp. CCMP2436]|nr:hypothetical protein T492DRAFT_857060 [Pavlovales sp. CCMP2436]